MTDARRFLRLIIPGGLFAVETAIFMLVLWPSWTADTLGTFPSVGGATAATVLLLGTGVLGFFFSALHFWLQEFCWYPRVDSTALIQALMRQGWLEVRFFPDTGDGTGELKPEKVNRDLAHGLALALWHEREESNATIKGINPRLSGLYDVAHSHGISFVATFWSLIAVLIIGCTFGTRSAEWHDIGHGAAVVILGGLALLLFWSNYKRVLDLSKDVSRQALLDAIHHERSALESALAAPGPRDPWALAPRTCTKSTIKVRAHLLAPTDRPGLSVDADESCGS